MIVNDFPYIGMQSNSYFAFVYLEQKRKEPTFSKDRLLVAFIVVFYVAFSTYKLTGVTEQVTVPVAGAVSVAAVATNVNVFFGLAHPT